jgi:DNA polymerase
MARHLVANWREANSWVADYAGELWDAMLRARAAPGHATTAGRITMVFLRPYLGGSLLCRLPSGRFLTYRQLRMEYVDVLDDDDQVIGRKLELTFRRGYGRVTLWPGLLLENFTQATAADVLRGTLVRLEDEHQAVRLHTHDEVLVEVPNQIAEMIALSLRIVMRQGFDWSEDLPLMSEETIAPYYTKQEKHDARLVQ